MTRVEPALKQRDPLNSQPGLCRNLIIESHTSWSPLCNSTVQGRHLRSDDRGYACSIRGLNPRTGCCIEERMRYSFLRRR
ncbi:hypothetical protein R1flu_025112 [Riccia fluitans]|uniref:Ribosomal protein S14 n=1 Tax=Riccia fluitans TaxID=41844 RepID=A0ABD1XX74_9MARC